VNSSPATIGEVPALLVTVTSTVAAERRAGDVVVIVKSSTTLKEPTAVAPKLTDVAPVKLVPVIVTAVPPPVGPEVGLNEVTDGMRTYVY
jgi:hypothetical protein